ncbi:MAG: ATP-binding protein [Gemmatimonadota bacterium]
MGRPRLTYERRIPLLALIAGLPAVVLALVLLWSDEHSLRVQWTLSLLTVSVWLTVVRVLHVRLVRPLHSLSNTMAALHDGDYSMRARVGEPGDALGLIGHELNALGTTLREQRIGVLEATALLRRVMGEIDVVVIVFDENDRLVLVNRAGERLLGRSAESLHGRKADVLGLGALLGGSEPRVVELRLPGASSRWEVRVSRLRQDGRPHRLLVLSDLSRALRDEERKAWRRLVRVLGHEINNSLAPIQSIARSLLQRRVGQADRPSELDAEDLSLGLEVIANRSESLSRFMAAYARLARLPAPKRASMDVGSWIQRVADLEQRVEVRRLPGPPLTLRADADQLEQLLINLIDNAVDASLETGGGVRVGWGLRAGALEVWVEDDGPGISETSNLFVPFFTTKPDGSGIGLALSREIAEAHGGSLSLENREAGPGAIARLLLPLGEMSERESA